MRYKITKVISLTVLRLARNQMLKTISFKLLRLMFPLFVFSFFAGQIGQPEVTLTFNVCVKLPSDHARGQTYCTFI